MWAHHIQACTNRHIVNSNHNAHGCSEQKDVRLQGLGVGQQRHTLRAATTAKAIACLAPMGSRFTMPPKDLKATSCAAGAAPQNTTIGLRIENGVVVGARGGPEGGVGGIDCEAGLSIERYDRSHRHLASQAHVQHVC